MGELQVDQSEHDNLTTILATEDLLRKEEASKWSKAEEVIEDNLNDGSMLSRKETREVKNNEDDLTKGTRKLNRIMEDRENNVNKLAEIIETELKRNKERLKELQESHLKVQSEIESTA